MPSDRLSRWLGGQDRRSNRERALNSTRGLSTRKFASVPATVSVWTRLRSVVRCLFAVL